MPQNTNLNVSPYFDDFDSEKNFNKVLFKPGTPVQARELTTLQSILQGQIEKFGKHIFKEGSIVIPGKFNYDFEYTYVKVESTFFGVPVESYYDKLIGVRIKGKDSGVTAKVVKVLPQSESLENSTTLYIKYEGSSDDLTRETFLDGENLVTLKDITYGVTTIADGSDFATASSSNATGFGSAFSLIRGIFFARGAFVEVKTETLILDQYGNEPSFRVGFLVREEIVTSVEDESLYDNAAGFSNFTAPGADRLKISLVLTKKPLTDFNDENFIELFRTDVGEVKHLVDRTVYNELAKEFARRTYDESGNYYVTKFDLEPKECLNDRFSRFGQFTKDRLTEDGNVPSEDLMCMRIGPGKAYVRGFEVSVNGTKYLDIPKPRTTKTAETRAVGFEAGNRLRLNNVHHAAQIRLAAGNADFVDLRSDRLGSNKATAAGDSIGRARVYDYKLQSSAYVDNSSVYELYLFDIVTDTKLTINQAISLNAPALVQGSRSGARGMLRSNASGSTTLVLSETAGQFVLDEALIINGEQQGRVVTGITEYDLTDVKSVRSTGGGRTFGADVLMEEIANFGSIAVNLSAPSGGKSTISSGVTGWAKKIRPGSIISYTATGITVPVFHKITSVSGSGFSAECEAVQTVTNVCNGALPSGALTVSGVRVLGGRVKESKKGTLVADMPHTNVESVDLTESTIFVRDEATSQSTSSGGQLTLPSLVGSDYVYAAFDEERYNVTYTNGTTAVLSSDQFAFTNGGKSATISGLTASQSGNVIVQVTKQKSKVNSKVKTLVQCATLDITGSNKANSGVTTGLKDGLTTNGVYGKRVQDKEVSLDNADIIEVHAVFESSGSGTPTIPKLTLAAFSGPNQNNTDIQIGEVGIGKSSGAAALVLARSGVDAVEIVTRNNQNFFETEEISFQKSGVKANLSTNEPGDPNIRKNYVLDNGQRDEYYDFGRLTRKPNVSEPQGRLKVFYDRYDIQGDDSGDIVTASSYEKEQYDRVPSMGNVRNTDTIDIRPRVAQYSGSRSPFEFDSRIFSGGGSATNVLTSGENVTFDYDYYVGRKDRLYLNRNQSFTVIEGTPSDNPQLPEPVSQSFEIAQIHYKPYIYNARWEVDVKYKGTKRFTMRDIGKLEERLDTLEEVTSLSLLESKTDSLVIRDPSTGLDRFKNGFVVDPFNDFNVTDKTQTEIKYEIDDGMMISKKYRDSIDLLIGSNSVVGVNGAPDPTVDPRYATDLGSPNVKKIGNHVTLNYNEVADREQLFATRLESVNPYMYRDWNGMLTLDPEDDVYIDRNQVTITEGEGFANDFFSQGAPVPHVREQNIEFNATTLKPDTKHYAYWSGTDMIDENNYIIPKLLEVTPVSGSFQIGETVSGPNIRFRLASPNHKAGPFNSPQIVYDINPYSPNVGLSSSYSETSSVLNVDCAALNQKSDGNFFGRVSTGIRLVGETSGAQADIADVRLVTDDLGTVQGCYYIPPDTFRDGTHSSLITQVKPENVIPGKNISNANSEWFSEGFEITDTTVIRTEPALPIPVINHNYFITNNITNVTNITQVQPEQHDDDPLAQSFEVAEEGGMFMTGVDFYFQSRSEKIPLKVRIVTMESGYPSQKIMKNSEVEVDPINVNISDDGTIPTHFGFRAPVYLPKGDYAFYLGSSSGDYDAWISQVGEADIRTANLSQFQKIIVSKQPTQGSLFKAQSNVTWTASQLEDLKYKSYRAEFTTEPGTVRMYNPALQTYGTRNNLPSNPIETFAKRVYVGLSSGSTSPHLINGAVISQVNNTTARGVIAESLGHIANNDEDALGITYGGVGYEDGAAQSVSLVTMSGRGQGAVGILTVSGGIITSATIDPTSTGNGYKVGDTLTANLGSKGLGENLLLTVGVTTATSGLVLTNVSGAEFNTSDSISIVPQLGSGVGVASAQSGIVPSSVVVNSDEYDGKHFRVTHPSHGHYSNNDHAQLTGVGGDSVPTKLTVGYAASVTSVVSVGSSTGFSWFEGAQVSASNIGYALIDNEVISYTSVGVNQLSGTITRGVDGTIPINHEINAPVQKYEISGISLRKVNTEHDLAQVNGAVNASLDSYFGKITGTKFFEKDKVTGGDKGKGSMNICFDTVNPNISHSLPIGTKLTGKIRTTSGASIDGNETAFLDQGYQDISLFGRTQLDSPRIIASKVNELDKSTLLALPGGKSFTFEATLSTTDKNVSPIINVFKSSVLTEGSRINRPITNFKTDRRSNLLDDPHAMLYQTKEILLENPSQSLKVLFAADRPAEADIRVLYRLKREDNSEFDKVFELMPGFENIDNQGDVIDPKNNSGKADTLVPPSTDGNFIEYEFTADNLPSFTAFQVKVVIGSVSSSKTPRLLDFRAIAVA